MIQVSIIVVNYNTVELTLNCLSSIYLWTTDINFEIILVDNASNDNSVSLIRSQFPNVILVESNENLGFGNANNLAVKYAKGRFIFLVNTDITFIQNSVKILFDFYNKNNDLLQIGCIGGQLLDINFKLEGCGEKFPTGLTIAKQKLSSIPFIRKYLKNDTANYWKLDEDFFQVDYVMGADLFMEKKIFDSLGGFDPYYFMYFEETDLSLQISKLGFKHYIVNSVQIIHSAVLKNDEPVVKPFKSHWLRTTIKRSEVYYIRKNFKKQFFKYISVDLIITILTFFSLKYRFKENLDYFNKTIKFYKLALKSK